MLLAEVWRRRTSAITTSTTPIRAIGRPTKRPAPPHTNDITPSATRKSTKIRVTGDMTPSFPRSPSWKLNSPARALQPARVHELEVAALDLPERVQVVVVPAPVGGPGDVPGGAVVGHIRAVALERPEHH